MNYTTVESILLVPIRPGGLYAIDLDDTIFCTDMSSGVWREENTTLCDARIPLWLHRVASVSEVIYLTARPPESRDATLRQLQQYNLPICPILFTPYKGPVLANYCKASPINRYMFIIFIDDLMYNIESVLKFCPRTQCYHISR
jgi:phosphatidate phosphatase APP1